MRTFTLLQAFVILYSTNQPKFVDLNTSYCETNPWCYKETKLCFESQIQESNSTKFDTELFSYFHAHILRGITLDKSSIKRFCFRMSNPATTGDASKEADGSSSNAIAVEAISERLSKWQV